MKKKDFLFIFCILLFLIGGYLFFRAPNKDECVEVYYHEKLVKSIDLNKDGHYIYQGDYGRFEVEVCDHHYRAINVECPNHICEKVGWVEKGSSVPIICVPNDIYIIQKNNESFQ